MNAERRALISVTDKRGLVPFARALSERFGFELVASSGSARVLQQAGIDVTPLEALTGFAELLGARVKTLHPHVHAAILARARAEDLRELAQRGIAPIDLVVVNLYRFEEAVHEQLALETLVERIDVGGVALLRAAAKNADRVAAVCDPALYAEVLEALERHGEVPLVLRRRLAVRAFRLTAGYDAMIAAALAGRFEETGQREPFPERWTGGWWPRRTLRYGENPHQRAALYLEPTAPGGGVAHGVQLQGAALSYNNLLDGEAAWALVQAFARQPAVAIVKHTNPCGCALGSSALEAFEGALASDAVSAFGGVVACNRVLDEETAARIAARFFELVVAPGVSEPARARLARRERLRVLVVRPTPVASQAAGAGRAVEVRSLAGALLVQERDEVSAAAQPFRVVSARAPGAHEERALRFAWTVCRFVCSNAIVLAGERATIGIGAGQMSRVDAVEIAVRKAGARAHGSVMASDGFFPFADGIERAAAAGVRAVIQPGGSRRDREVIAAADRAGMAMVFTGRRCFRH